MEHFGTAFMKSKGQPIEYKGKTIMMADDFPLPNKETKLLYKILSVNSEWLQGFAVRTKGWIKFEDEQVIVKKGWAAIWSNIAPCKGEFICQSKESVLLVKNIWDTGNGCIESWNNGAAMWFEEIPNGRRYHCNDGHFDDDFDELIFELTIVPE